MRKFKFLLSIIIVTVGGYMLYQFTQNNTSDKKIDYQVQSAQAKDSSDSKNNVDTAIDTNADSNKSTNIDSLNKTNNTTSNDDFSVLVESPIYNAVVSLDEGSKEFKVKLLDDVSDNVKDETSHYIKFSKDDIDYLTANIDTLIDQFKNGGLFDKYNMVTSMLKSYDTNINQGDLIGLALSFIK